MVDREAVVRVSVSRGSRLHFSWGLGPELHLMEIQNPKSEPGDFSNFVTRACWGLATDINRTISYSTAEQFKEMQRARLSGIFDDAYVVRVASYARTIRENLMRWRVALNTDDGLSQVEAAIWNLLEIFFVDAPRHEGNLGEDFVYWVNAHAELLEETAGAQLCNRLKEIRREDCPNASRDYWTIVRRLVALGRTPVALELLNRHELHRVAAEAERSGRPLPPGLAAQLELINLLIVVVSREPRMAPSAGRDPTARAYSSLVDFTAARSLWLKVVHDNTSSESTFAAAAAASKFTADGVRSVLEVLLGQPAALRNATSSWLELAAAEVVHRQGGAVVTANQLGALLAECQAAFKQREDGEEGGSPALEFFAQVLEAVMDTDIAGVVSVLSNSGLVGHWLVAHALEVLAAYPGTAAAVGGGTGVGAGGAGILTERLAISGCDQMEYFRLSWADSLLPYCMGGGWHLALQYLAWCPQHGEAAAEAMLEAMPVDSRDTRTLEKALVACRRLGLGSSAAVLCRMAGVDALARGQLGSGVQWMLRAADPRRTTAVLQLLGDVVAYSLDNQLGRYRAEPLELPGGSELEALLEWLPASGGAEAGEGAVGTTASSTVCSLAAFLADVLKLSRAMGALAAARDESAPSDDPATLGSLAAGRAALMSMVQRRTPPRHLCVHLLFYAIPLLEACSAGGSLFSIEDVQQLRDWLSECVMKESAGGAGMYESLSLAPLEASLGHHARFARDVQLALVRAVARAHVLYGGVGSSGGVRLVP